MPPLFIAPVLSGMQRGTQLGFPTLNLDPEHAPPDLAEGIYAARITFDGNTFAAAVHHGRRLSFEGNRTLEAHVIDATIPEAPAAVVIEIVERLRGVQRFPDTEALKEQIATDVQRAREILQNHAASSSSAFQQLGHLGGKK